MIYFDNAATTIPKPKSVIETLANSVNTMANSSRGAYTSSLMALRNVYATRCKVAKLFGVEKAENVAFASNGTEALNTAIFGLFSENDEVITTVCEHNSVLRPLYILENMGVKVRFINADNKGVLDYESIEKMINKNTKAFVINHASNVTGNVADLSF
ncbi:MAG: aminotransferase class V-fold PLP-dependent enzyme, partial [Lachnospirales bacterium]